jgi:hypothetical protein
MAKLGKIEDAILTLPLGAQMQLYSRLGQHLFGAADPDRTSVDPAVLEEMQRRLARYKAGTTTAMPLDTAMTVARLRTRDANHTS